MGPKFSTSTLLYVHIPQANISQPPPPTHVSLCDRAHLIQTAMHAGSWLFLTPQDVLALRLPEHDLVRTAGLLKFCD